VSVGRQWKRFCEGMISSNRENCGRERLIGTATKKKIIETVLGNRFLIIEDL
jgi:hypothetical protein